MVAESSDGMTYSIVSTQPGTGTPVPPTSTPLPEATSTPTASVVDTVYMTSSSGGSVSGISFSDEDIIAQNLLTNSWSILLDLSDVGVSNDTNAFHIMDDGSILLSFSSSTDVPNVGIIDDSDIVRFIPTSVGSATTGTFEMYFDGSDVGLSDSGEDLDAITVLSNGDLLLSGLGVTDVGLGTWQDEDLFRFSPTSLGTSTSGTFSYYFDGSDVGLSGSDEDIHGISIASDGDLYLTTRRDFSGTWLSGQQEDIVVCAAPTIGSASACNGGSVFWDGIAAGIADEQLDGIAVGSDYTSVFDTATDAFVDSIGTDDFTDAGTDVTNRLAGSATDSLEEDEFDRMDDPDSAENVRPTSVTMQRQASSSGLVLLVITLFTVCVMTTTVHLVTRRRKTT